MSFRSVRVWPKVLRFSPGQREQVITIENGCPQPVEFEIAAHRSNRAGSGASLFQSNLPSGRLSGASCERILVQYCGEFSALDTDCAETLQLLLRNDQQELHLVTLDCEFELDETGGSVIKTGRQIVRSDGLLLDEDLDAIYGQRTPTGGGGGGGGGRRRQNDPARGGADAAQDKESLRPISRMQRKSRFRRLGWLSRLVLALSVALFAAMVYLIFFSPVDAGWARLIKVYGLGKSADRCSFFGSGEPDHSQRIPAKW